MKRSIQLSAFLSLILCSGLGHAQSNETIDGYWNQRDIWLADLVEYIPVLELASGDSSDEEKRLTARLESLQNKKVSNREWHEYWQQQADLATSLTEKLKTLTPQALETQRRAMHAALKKLRTQSSSPSLVIAAKVAALRTEVRQIGQTNGTLEAQVARVRTTLTKLATTASSLEGQASSETTDEERANLKRAITETETKINRLSATYRTNEARLLEKEQLLDVLANEPTSVDSATLAKDGELKKAVEALRKMKSDTSNNQTHSEKINALKLNIERLDTLRRTRVKERLFLQKWATLARSKTVGQDAYLNAIEDELSAVESRLKSFHGKQKKAEDDEAEEDPCRPPVTSKKSPFDQHRRCVASLEQTLEQLERNEEQTKLQQVMYKELSKTNLALIAAQQKDVELVRSERELAEQGTLLLPSDTIWRSAWQTYAKRGEKKVEELEKALRQSRKEKRELKAKTAVLKVTAESIASQRIQQGNLLTDRSGFDDSLKALGLTILGIIQVGWPALVYILFAFTLIRIVNKFRDKKEKEGEDVDSGDTHELLESLEKSLQLAEAQEDEAKVMEIHEEIGRLESQLKDQGQRMATIARVAAQAVTLVIYIATGLLVLDALTVDIGPILGGAAIFGLAISFGSQSLVKDVVSGFFILLENQYAVGDVVTINGQSGTVEKVTLRRTVLRSMRGEVHNLTNGSISSVTNMTQGWARVVIDLGVAYGTDIDHVKKVVNEVGNEMYLAEEWRGKLTEKPSFVGVTAFGESEITVRAWCKTKTFQNWGVERELNLRLKTAFEAENIEIPFPKRDINVVVQTQSELTSAFEPKPS